MNVCMVVYSFYETDTRVMQYANALIERGDSVDVIALRQEGHTTYAEIGGVRVYRIQERKINERGQFSYLYRILRFWVLATILLTRNHLAKRYQLIHVHNVPDFLVFTALVPRMMGTPVILDIHDVLPEMFADKFGITKDALLFKALALVERASIAFSSHTIIANDIWHKRLISRSTTAEKCTTIRNYPDQKIFHPLAKERNVEKFLIIYPGSLNWYQGVDVAIKAFARVADKMPEAEFHIYGSGAAKPGLIELVQDLGMTERIQFPTPLSASEIARVMANADLAIEPKQARSAFANEASSMKIMEFMAVDVPVIVSRTSIHAYYYDETMVKFFESHNDAELAEHILLLRQNDKLRARLVANARNYIEKNNWGSKKRDYLDLVDSLVYPSRPRTKRVDDSPVEGSSAESPLVYDSRSSR